MRALLGTAAHFCEVVILKMKTSLNCMTSSNTPNDTTPPSFPFPTRNASVKSCFGVWGLLPLYIPDAFLRKGPTQEFARPYFLAFRAPTRNASVKSCFGVWCLEFARTGSAARSEIPLGTASVGIWALRAPKGARV